MAHRVITIDSTVVPAALTEDKPIIDAVITYRPADETSPQECGKTVTRILKRLPGLADAQADE